MSMRILQPGTLSTIQDSGRYGFAHLGLSNGGPMDLDAYYYCNRLLENDANSSVIEITLGGLSLEAQTNSWICLTGAPMPLRVNHEPLSSWAVHKISSGDIIDIDYAASGTRAYLGVAQGFTVAPQFGSTATVVREGVGGLSGCALQAGDVLQYSEVATRQRLHLRPQHQPRYQRAATLRVIPGYQHRDFTREMKRRFFSHEFLVTQKSDRMGYRLQGPAIDCDIDGIASEGIGFGAIQIPPDGQPIVLLNDRQTLGGYPKIGSILPIDAACLAQLQTGSSVHFAPISTHTAQRALLLAQRFTLNRPIESL